MGSGCVNANNFVFGITYGQAFAHLNRDVTFKLRHLRTKAQVATINKIRVHVCLLQFVKAVHPYRGGFNTPSDEPEAGEQLGFVAA